MNPRRRALQKLKIQVQIGWIVKGSVTQSLMERTKGRLNFGDESRIPWLAKIHPEELKDPEWRAILVDRRKYDT